MYIHQICRLNIHSKTTKNTQIMKKEFLIFVMLAYVLFSYAQDYPVDMYYTLSRSYAGWKAKSNVHIVKISHHTFISGVNPNSPTIEENFCLYEEGSNEPHEIKTKFDGAMVCDYKKVEDVWNHYIIGSVFNMIQKKGFQTPLRNELEDDAIDFINKLQNDGRAFKDPYLENYIYSLVAKIAPVTLIDGRPGNVNIVILDDAVQNAFTFSNGTIVVTTGLLAALHTEDELVAILAHEIAHFVLDHSIANVNADAKRQKRAEFWASVATGVAAVAEGVAAMKNPYYKPGNGTLAVAMISSSIAESYLKRQGMAYNPIIMNKKVRLIKLHGNCLDFWDMIKMHWQQPCQDYGRHIMMKEVMPFTMHHTPTLLLLRELQIWESQMKSVTLNMRKWSHLQ